MSKQIFIEEQRFSQKWLWILLFAALIGMSLAFIQDYNTSSQFIASMAVGYTVLLLVMLLIWSLKLKTRIDEMGIHVTFWPIIRKEKIYQWNDIESAEVIQYSPLKDYGGWGYRYSLGSKGTAMNVKGNMGIKLHFKSGRPLLIGTQKTEEAKRLIQQYHSPKSL